VPLLPVGSVGGERLSAEGVAMVAPAADPTLDGNVAPDPNRDMAMPADAPPALPDARHASVYFDSGSAQLPADASDTLAEVVRSLKDDAAAMATISGYHDASGDRAANAELARQRAQNVANALAVAGIEASRIDLVKPVLAAASADPAEARRVDVAVR